MSDKITKFEDYKNKAATPEPVSQDTMNIEIEDPFQFLSAEEREEYILQRRKELGEDAPKEPRRQPEEDRPREERPREERPREERPREERRPRDPEPVRRPPREQYQPEDEPDYGEDYDGEDYEEDEDEGGINMNLVVRVSSIITGIVILAFIAMALKVKVYDRYFAPDPDEAPVSVVAPAPAPALPAGYVEKNDTVVVSGAQILNIRSVPSSESSETVVGMVPEGDELKRIAVSEDGHWALVEVDGQQVYASMKYLKEK